MCASAILPRYSIFITSVDSLIPRERRHWRRRGNARIHERLFPSRARMVIPNKTYPKPSFVHTDRKATSVTCWSLSHTFCRGAGFAFSARKLDQSSTSRQRTSRRSATRSTCFCANTGRSFARMPGNHFGFTTLQSRVSLVGLFSSHHPGSASRGDT